MVLSFPLPHNFFSLGMHTRICTQTKICTWFYLEALMRVVNLCVSSLFLQQKSYSEFCTELPLHMQKIKILGNYYFS